MNPIEVKNFKKSFGSKVVHKGVSFSLQSGECLGLIGGSGTGKSVLLRSLIGLEKPDSGQILIHGEDITQLKESHLIEIRKHIAYVFQNGALFDSMTVYENLAYPLRAHTQLNENEIADKVHKILSDFGLSGNESNYSVNLSGGMQKRLGLARSIILNPEIVLYDEPTAGLDPYNTHKIQDMILKLKEIGRSSILVTHDMPVAFNVCDRIAILYQGCIHSVGTVSEIRKQENHIISKFASGEIN